MKILNLYAGIGGNRKNWGDEHEITAVENNEQILSVYRDFFPNDKWFLGDAHQYLLDHYNEFDFIWSSPPCPTHGQYRFNVGVKGKGFKALYPDMKLYEEIILLQYYFKEKYLIENVVSFYEPLIKPQRIARHFFWANFNLGEFKIKGTGIGYKNKISEMEETHGYDLSKYKISDKRQILRNCTEPELGKHILDLAINPINLQGSFL